MFKGQLSSPPVNPLAITKAYLDLTSHELALLDCLKIVLARPAFFQLLLHNNTILHSYSKTR
jgi:hypothetical protein